jgi:hypothetical protein
MPPTSTDDSPDPLASGSDGRPAVGPSGTSSPIDPPSEDGFFLRLFDFEFEGLPRAVAGRWLFILAVVLCGLLAAGTQIVLIGLSRGWVQMIIFIFAGLIVWTLDVLLLMGVRRCIVRWAAGTDREAAG